MKKKILILLNVFCLIDGQTNDQIKQAKNLIKNSGMSETEIKSAARAQGYSDEQIENAAQKTGAVNIESMLKNHKENLKKGTIENYQLFDR